MATAATKFAGHVVTDARLTIPAWGASYVDVSLDGETALSGAVTLSMADLSWQGTVLSGGPAQGRSYFRAVAGAAGWGKTLSRRSYANDAGVKLLKILSDAAGEVGETFDPSTIDPSASVGPYFVRPADLACRLLEQLAPNAWYVGEDGKTRLGSRPATTLPAPATATSQVDLARGTVTLASDSIAGILPGLSVGGLVAVDVEHSADAKEGLRSKIWGAQGAGLSRRLAALRAIAAQMDPDRNFRAVWEYRIVTQDVERLNLQAVRVSTGMPDLQRVIVRPGVPGVKANYALGATVLVGFVNADPSRPVVLAFTDAESGGFVPTLTMLAGGGAAVGRVGDSVQVTIDATVAGKLTSSPSGGPLTITVADQPSFTVAGTITAGSSKVTCG